MALFASGLTIRNVLNRSPMFSRVSSVVSAVGENDDVVMAPPEKELIAITYLMAPGKRYHRLNDILGVVVLNLLCFQNVAS